VAAACEGPRPNIGFFNMDSVPRGNGKLHCCEIPRGSASKEDHQQGRHVSRSGETETRILRSNGEDSETRGDPTRNECSTSRSVKRFFFDAKQDHDGGSGRGSRSGGDRTGGAGEESDGTNAGYIVPPVLLRQRESQVFEP